MRASLPALPAQRAAALPVGWLAALVIGVLVLSAIMPEFQARPGSTVAAVFPPWWSRETAFRAAAQAGVAIVASSRLPNVLMVSANSVSTLAGLYRSGAWSLIGTGGGAGCFASLNAFAAARPVRGS
jgi:hypothetical protein